MQEKKLKKMLIKDNKNITLGY